MSSNDRSISSLFSLPRLWHALLCSIPNTSMSTHIRQQPAREKGEKYNKNVVCGDDNCVNGKKKKEVPEKEKPLPDIIWYVRLSANSRRLKKKKRKGKYPRDDEVRMNGRTQKSEKTLHSCRHWKEWSLTLEKRLSTRQLSSSFLFPYSHFRFL